MVGRTLAHYKWTAGFNAAVWAEAVEVRQEPMVAQAIRRQFAYEFLVAVLALVIDGGWIHALARSVGCDRTEIHPLRMSFSLDDDLPRLVPRIGFVHQGEK